MDNRSFYAWLVSSLLIFTAIFWSYYTGILPIIYSVDETKLTIIISIFFLIAVFINGLVSAGFVDEDKTSKYMDSSWFLSELVMGLGMLGTVIGIILLLGVGHSIDIQSPEALPKVIAKMWSTLGTAFYPNVMGLIASMTIKLQTHILAKYYEE